MNKTKFDIEGGQRKEVTPIMKAKIIGTQAVSFVNNNGETIKGNNIFIAFKDESTIGHRTEKFFVKESIPLPIKVDDTVEISFNYKGKLESITKIN